MTQWPYFYFPTRALFVDDQKSFLTALNSRLPSNLLVKLFNHPKEALAYILNYNVSIWDRIQPIHSIDNPEFESQKNIMPATYVGLQWDFFSNIIHETNRFEIPSVVIVDQMMPEMDGIEFCRKLKDHPIKKIMLTANEDQEVAVKAFNEGIIDYFILKNSTDLEKKVIEAILKLQKKYFEIQAEHYLGSFSHTIPLLNNALAIHFYENLKNQLGAIEFYLLDQWGSTLFLTAEGISTTLAMCSVELLQNFSQIAEDQEEYKISDDLLNKRNIIFFQNKNDMMRPVSQWGTFLYPAIPFPHCDDLYYHVITNPLS